MSYTPDFLVNKEQFEKIRYTNLEKPLTREEKAIQKLEDFYHKQYDKISKQIDKMEGLSNDEKSDLRKSRTEPLRESKEAGINEIKKQNLVESKETDYNLSLIEGRELISGDHNEVKIREITFIWIETNFSGQTSAITNFCDGFGIEYYKSY